MPEQDSIPVGDPTPNEHGDCDWCAEPAVETKEIRHKLGRGQVPTGMFVAFCGAHRDTAQRALDDASTRKMK